MKYRIDHGEDWPVYHLLEPDDSFRVYVDDGEIELTDAEYAEYKAASAAYAAWQRRLDEARHADQAR